MNIFYAEDLSDARLLLNKEESNHAVHVLRLRTGETITLVDGKGTMARALITVNNLKACEVQLVEKHENFEPRPYYLHLAMAPTKNIDRFEWFLEKATEIGIDEITPLLCKHSERKEIKAERLEKLIVSACKQSVKARFPVLNPMISFLDFIQRDMDAIHLIAHCRAGEKQSLKKILQPGKDALIMIGPEGDFDETEIEAAVKRGFIPISLGTSRLRTETAGVVACQSVSFINEDL